MESLKPEFGTITQKTILDKNSKMFFLIDRVL